MAEVALDVESEADDDLDNPYKNIATDHGKSRKHFDLARVSFCDSDNLVRGQHVEGSTEEEASNGRENEDDDHIEGQSIKKDQTSRDNET